MISTTNIEEVKRLIKKSTQKPIIVQAQDLEFNRKILEYGKFDILLFPEKSKNKKDKLKTLDSGINHVLATIAAKNKVSVGIDLAAISALAAKEKSVQLARLAQNIQIARKAKARIVCINYKDSKDASALLTSLGASSQQASEAVN